MILCQNKLSLNLIWLDIVKTILRVCIYIYALNLISLNI
jgi:hypothetical protein